MRITFPAHAWPALAALACCVASFAYYIRAEQHLNAANEARQRSFLLADELRQSSDDLTRMVRTYVVTRDPAYKRHYQEILDIRDGRVPRPPEYQGIYWDLVVAGGPPPGGAGQRVPLVDLMKAAGFTAPEFERLAEAKARSDELARLERTAMAMVEGEGADARHEAAVAVLHDAAYHRAKAAIMAPIAEFSRIASERTRRLVQAAARRAEFARATFVVFAGLLVMLLWRHAAQRAQAEVERSLRVAIDAASEGVCIVEGGIIRFANPKVMELAGCPAEELVGRRMLELVHRDDQARVDEAYQRRLRGDAAQLQQRAFRMNTRHKGTRWVEVNLAPFQWSGRPAALLFLEDVTERRQAEQQLRQLTDLVLGMPAVLHPEAR